MNQTQLIANEFSRILHEWLTADQMQTVISANKASNYEFDESHSFCDSNQAMLDAFETVTGKEWQFDGDEKQRNAEMQLMCDSWDLAMKNDYNQITT